MPTIAEILARELDKPLAHVQNVIDLLDQGNTIPFIARYRKELHGSMDDTALRTLEDRLSYLRNLDQRRQEVKNAIDGQGKLTDELSAAIDSAATLAEVEDLYRPYKQKRRTRATVAREKGLEPLALLLLDQGRDCPAPEEAARDYVDPEKGVETLADALQGANDIVAELLSDDAAIRKTLRELLRRQGHLRSLAATEEDTVYRLYYDFDQPIAKLAGHQVLAINRGEKEGVLSVTVLLDRELGLMTLRRAVVRPGSRAMEFIKAACEDAYDRLIYPSLEREARSDLTASACEGAIANFGLNLKPLLMQPPVKGHVTMGLDPGYAHGCKVAVIDGTGKVLDTAVVYPTYGPRQKQEAIDRLSRLVRRHGVTHIAIGNGTASRETEQMAVEMIRALGGGVSYMMVNEAGASVYSASKLAAEEFPEYDVNLRSAVSIARRMQDPPGGAGEDRPQGHRRGAVSARYAPEAAGRDADRRGGGLRQRRGRGREHRLRQPAGPGVRPERRHRQKYCEIPGGKRRLHRPPPASEGAQAGTQGLPAVGGLPAGAGEQVCAGQHRRPSGELRRRGGTSGPVRLYAGGCVRREAGGPAPEGEGPGLGGDRRPAERRRSHPAGRGGGAGQARPGRPGRPACPHSANGRAGH